MGGVESHLKETSGVVQRFPLTVLGFDRPERDEGRKNDSLVVIIDKRALERECLARGLVEYSRALRVTAVESLDEFKQLPNEADACAVVVTLGGRNVSEEDVGAELSDFIANVGP